MLSFYEIITKLQEFWQKQGAIPIFSHNMYVGAGTFHPKCFFSSLNNKESAYTYVQKSTRKADARYGQSPNRLLNHHQLQVMFTPGKADFKEVFLQSLEYIGINRTMNFILFNDNNWENISIGAIGVGWEVLCNNTEICQITWFQKMADIDLQLNTLEFAFGLERLAFVLWKKSIFEIPFYKDILYKDEFLEIEKQFSVYFLEKNQTNEDIFFQLQDQCLELLMNNLYLPAYEVLLKMIDVFNDLDAMKKISIIKRKEYISITRNLSNKIALKYIEIIQKTKD